MSNVFQCLSLADKASALSLGPVRISAKYPADTTSGGKRRRNIMVKDESGSSKMTLWGAAADLPLVDGAVVVFKGTIKKNEYNGVTSITAEQITAEPADGSTPLAAAASHAPRSGSAPAASFAAEEKIDHVELAKQMAHFTHEFGRQLISVGILGEYIGRIYEEVRSRPKFIVDRAEGFKID